MNAIILAAGEGKRLRPITNDKPKSLVKLFGKTLLEWQLSIFQKCGIDDICVVTGYNSQLINYPGLDYIKNNNFMNTNMMESLFCASEKLSDSVIISYTDIIFEQKMIQQILQFSGDIGIAVNLNWKKNYGGRTLHPLSEAENVLIKNEKIIQIKKDISEKSSGQKIGEFLGIIKLRNISTVILQKHLQQLRKIHKGKFHDAKSFELAKLMDFLQDLVESKVEINPIFVDGKWCEIDTPKDLELARKQFL